MKKLTLILIAIPLLTLWGCKKEPKKGNGNASFKTTYNIDGAALMTDTFAYLSEAGYEYKITRVEYFLSGFRLKHEDGNIYMSEKVLYINAFKPETNTFTFKDIPSGKYTEIAFYFGIDSAHNISRSLDANIDMANMSWPDQMGGGYHFMKFEGVFKNNDKEEGFAMHLGNNKNLIDIHLNHSFEINIDNTSSLTLSMNLNEWFKNPEVYDFVTDGSYSMNKPPAMQKLKKNGADIFQVK
ncbi:MAG: hypothetical protein J5I91_00605 [Bacteroidetes bacterium]|nr:hypothetical protein [Bacteroidota bacterium]